MPTFENEELVCSFSIPDKPTIRQILRYDSVVELNGFAGDTYERLWNGVKHIVSDWKCPHVDPRADLDDVTSLDAMRVIKWSGLIVWTFVDDLKHVPKNS